MVELKHRKGLDLDEQPAFQQREWRASRILWAVLLLTMTAVGLGLFGNGPLSRTRAEASPGGLAVEYERFGRFGASMSLVAQAPVQPDGSTTVELSRSLADAFLLTNTTPVPTESRLTSDGALYRFNATPGARAVITFALQPRQRWLVTGHVRSGGESVRLRQFIYP